VKFIRRMIVCICSEYPEYQVRIMKLMCTFIVYSNASTL
jgi:hypothetical protein